MKVKLTELLRRGEYGTPVRIFPWEDSLTNLNTFRLISRVMLANCVGSSRKRKSTENRA